MSFKFLSLADNRPGPPTVSAGTSPSFFVQYKKVSPDEKLHTLRHYLDMGPEEAPSLIFNYMPEVDQAGHRGGPDSADVETALGVVDGFVGSVVAEIEARNLSHIVDLLVLSDHGMTGLSKQRTVFLDDVLEADFAKITHKDGWPSFGLHFGAEDDLEPVMAKLKDASTGEARQNFTVYTPQTMPERWHFSHGPRIAPVYLVPDLGWIITDHVSRTGGGEQPCGRRSADSSRPSTSATSRATRWSRGATGSVSYSDFSLTS